MYTGYLRIKLCHGSQKLASVWKYPITRSAPHEEETSLLMINTSTSKERINDVGYSTNTFFSEKQIVICLCDYSFTIYHILFFFKVCLKFRRPLLSTEKRNVMLHCTLNQSCVKVYRYKFSKSSAQYLSRSLASSFFGQIRISRPSAIYLF